MQDGDARLALDALPVAVALVDRAGVLVHRNPCCAAQYGLREGRPLAAGFAPGARPDAEVWVRAVAAGPGRSAPFEGWLAAADGGMVWVHAVGSSVAAADGGVGAVVTLEDRTELQQERTRLLLGAGFDPLTGLVNRTLLQDRLRRAEGGSVVLLDLDEFRRVNDVHGHEAADRVLEAVARRLLASFPPPATVARLGGDEFVALLPDDELEAAHAATVRALASLAEPLEMRGGPLVLTACAGIASARAGHPERALSRADAAVHAAKRSGPGTAAVLDPDERPLTRAQVGAHLHALEQQVRTDPLTGLPNVRALRESLDALGRTASLDGTPFSSAFLDIDHFGAYNHTHGDAAGDRTLTAVGQALKTAVRTGDRVFRKGGEELVVLMPGTVVEDAAVVGERLGAAVRDLGLPHGGAPATPVVTVTIGVAGWLPGEAPDDVLERSSQAAFSAKAEGSRGTVRRALPPGLRHTDAPGGLA